jgi:hypothetical protein
MGNFIMGFLYDNDCVEQKKSPILPPVESNQGKHLIQALIHAIIYEKNQYEDSSLLHPEYLTKYLLKNYDLLDCAILNTRYEHCDEVLFRKEEIQMDCRPLSYSLVCLKQTLLTLAARYSSPEVFLHLLNHPEIDPNVSNDEGDTPLHIATRLGRRDIVAALVNDPRTDITKKNAIGKSAHRLSRIHHYAEIEEIIMKADAEQAQTSIERQLSRNSISPVSR